MMYMYVNSDKPFSCQSVTNTFFYIVLILVFFLYLKTVADINTLWRLHVLRLIIISECLSEYFYIAFFPVSKSEKNAVKKLYSLQDSIFYLNSL